jgi:hypothetical protein
MSCGALKVEAYGLPTFEINCRKELCVNEVYLLNHPMDDD